MALRTLDLILLISCPFILRSVGDNLPILANSRDIKPFLPTYFKRNSSKDLLSVTKFKSVVKIFF